MTSLILPVACWLSTPFSSSCTVTALTTCDDGSTIVLGMDGGVGWIFAVDEGKALELRPKTLLSGHKSPITAIALGKIEVEGVARKENIILTASEDGEVIMWDIADGRCLQANQEAFPGSVTGIKMTSSGKYVICSGFANVVSILDASSLSTLRTICTYGNWVASMCLYPTETKYVDKIFAITLNGDLTVSTFNEQAMLFTHEIRHRIDASTGLPEAKVEINRYDKSLLMTVQKRCCMIFAAKSGKVSLTSQIPCEDGKGSWKGGKFLSAATLLLWSSSTVYLYYLGPDGDVIRTSDLASVPSDAVVLFARGNLAYYVRNMNTGHSQGNSAVTLIAAFQDTKDHIDGTSIIAHVPGKQNGLHHVLSFRQGGAISQWTFFASLLGAQLRGVQLEILSGSQGPGAAYLPDADFTLQSLWPLSEDPAPKVVSVASVSNKYIAKGYENGEIRIIPVRCVFSDSAGDREEGAYLTLKGHIGPVTSIYAPHPRESGGRNVLLSGGMDCTVKVWNMDDGKLLASFLNHAEYVQGFVPIPSDAGQRLKSSIFSISKDRSIASIDLEDLRCCYRLTGHSHEIDSVHWRTLDEILVVACVDGTAYIWQLKTGHLDRIISGSDVDDILASCDGQVSCKSFGLGYQHVNIKKSISAFPIYTSEDDAPPLLAFQINTKRLISEIHGNQVLTPPATPPTNSALSRIHSQTQHPRRSSSLYSEHGSMDQSNIPSRPASPKPSAQHFSQNISHNFMDIFKSRPGSPSLLSSIGKSGSEREVSPAPSPKREEAETPRDENTKEPPDMEAVYALCAALMSWGLDNDLDSLCQERADFVRPGKHVAFGMRGANGYLSIFAPEKNPAADWMISSTVTAARLLNLLALTRPALSARGLEDQLSTIVTHYGTTLPSIVGRQFAFPSFSFLAKYWQDPIAEVQQVARTLFNSTLAKMGTEEKAAVIEYWRAHLPAISKKNTKMNTRAVIILGIVGSLQPDALNMRACKDVAESLDLLIREELRSVYRVAAVELLGSGFAIWEPHINGTSLLRTLINFSGLTTSTQSASGGAGSPTASPNPALIMVARQALVQIATINSALFISTLTFDLMHSKSATERAGSLKLLGMFIAKKPIILYPHLARIVEAIVKCLDPNQPQIRDSLQQIVTVNFAELVKTYPNVAFHHASQRLAVGTMEGIAIVYDVRIAARVQIMEGHTKPVAAVSFSPDGKLIATFSLEENTVRFWQPTGGFLGTLVGALTTGGATSGAAGVAALASVGGVGHMKSFRTFTLGPPPDTNTITPLDVVQGVKFEWNGERRVTLNSINGVQLAFTV
ncbi:uncharacterized protein SPPG_04244 [Spizellomyces punctatus DAOM BR117]|uniref:Non-specific serine/threonine protein kinase n=2 Tax=Spizellomyces punctatus (strain DAOM BR117) TaxID=645134 RepID=A0A0L0HJF2_SPIPD|nr:uncharacterized protein SPPG_04244 [Spizellomyces punctatus DAOM BR117]KND01153.1 hypothetical protein SPPG_04244 [Spizellomyces punctatus DAOM BR117]|eukprot:XP_016609192.1 hypothetical protein SPPG_04244 [Spizellomyces punctatus DAOM BR117]